MRLLGNGRVALTRMNWARCSLSEAAMNATTLTGNRSIRASRRAAVRCWPSTIQPGFSSSAIDSSTGMTRVPGIA